MKCTFSEALYHNSKIDPYWTILPPLMATYFKFHPLAIRDSLLSDRSYALIWIWSVRYQYFFVHILSCWLLVKDYHIPIWEGKAVLKG